MGLILTGCEGRAAERAKGSARSDGAFRLSGEEARLLSRESRSQPGMLCVSIVDGHDIKSEGTVALVISKREASDLEVNIRS